MAAAEENNVDSWIASLVMNRAMDFDIYRGFDPLHSWIISRRFALASVDTVASKVYDLLEHVYRYRNLNFKQRMATRFRRLFRRSNAFENEFPDHVSLLGNQPGSVSCR